jgi:hypothetical protein
MSEFQKGLMVGILFVVGCVVSIGATKSEVGRYTLVNQTTWNYRSERQDKMVVFDTKTAQTYTFLSSEEGGSRKRGWKKVEDTILEESDWKYFNNIR